MSAPRDLDRQIQSFLAEGPMDLPDASYDEVRDRMEQKRQRAFIGPWRTPDVSNSMKVGLAAALVVIGVIGFQFVGDFDTGSPGATETFEPTSMPTPRPLPSSGELSAGTYLMTAQYGPPFTFVVPAGWEATGDGLIVKNTGQKEILDITSGLMLGAWKVDHVYTDACRHQSGDIVPVGPSVDDLATALHQQEGRGASQPREVMLGGLRALEVILPSRAFISLCGGFVHTWPDFGGGEDGGFTAGMGQTDIVYIVDVEGERAVITASRWNGGSDTDQRELQRLLDSIEFVAAP